MIKIATEKFLDIMDELPNNMLVLDIGAASAPTARADYIIDYVAYDKINFSQLRGCDEKYRFNEKTYIQHDICTRGSWPFLDKQFDYSVCSHVLEDIRDPIWVCSEIIRVSKAGYIEIPSRMYESTFGVDHKKMAGACHHRWLIDLQDGKLRFTFKNFYIHDRKINKNNYHPVGEELYLRIEWSDSFDYFESWLNSGKEMFEYILERKISEKEKWNIFRKTGNHNYLIGWLKYLKNTNEGLLNLYNKFIVTKLNQSK